MGGSFVENQPATSSALNSSPVRTNMDATFAGDLQPLRVIAQDTPDMTVQVAGDNNRAYVSGNTALDYAGGNSGSFTAPAGGGEKQIDILHINSAGSLSITTGTPTTGTPVPPTYPGDEMVVAEIFLRQGMTVIKDTDDSTNGYVFKDRSPLLNLGSPPTDLVPSGGIIPYGGATAPAGFLLCDGTTGKDSVADTTLAALFAVIGTTFGGTGADDFDLPDMRGREPLGKDNMGGSSANRVTLSQADNIGQSEGQENVKAHSHSHSHVQRVYESGSGNDPTDGNKANTPSNTSLSTATDATSTGSGTSNMNPFLTLNYIIKK